MESELLLYSTIQCFQCITYIHFISYSFPPRMWNHFQNKGPRTNNHLEGWHNRLNRLARKAHPNLFESIELLQNEQAATEVQIIQLTDGVGLPRPKKRKAVRREQHIKKITDEFDSGVRSLDSYLSALGQMVVDFS